MSREPAGKSPGDDSLDVGCLDSDKETVDETGLAFDDWDWLWAGFWLIGS